MNRSFLSRVLVPLLLAGSPWFSSAAGLESSGLPEAAAKHWTADNGNGTYSNPLFYEEFEDPDVIRVGEDYYLAGTTMHMNPAVQIMHSKDLVNWDLAGYCTNRLDLGPAYRLDGGNIYGRGIWAPCIRYHDGVFYVFSNVNGAGLLVFRSKSIQGPWEWNQLPGRHDLSVLFDDDGKIYIISGNSSPYPVEELVPDLRSFVPGAHHQLVGRMGEGHHLYKVNGKYVDISAIPGGTVDQMVAVADSIDGPWKVDRMVQGESLGVTTVTPNRAQPGDRGLTLHQGGMVDTPAGEWWSVIMSDHGSAGRMVALVPITWDNGFPLIGLLANLRKAPNTWIKPNTGHVQEPKPAFIHDDNFDGPSLNPLWQWNHVPDDQKWSLTEKPGVLRLHSLPATNFYSARNSLCQRPPGPESVMTVELDSSGLVAGDTAGLALLSSPYAWIGVARTAEGTTLQMLDATGSGAGRRGAPATPPPPPTISPTNPPSHLWLRVACNFDTDQAVFSWSGDGRQFTALGQPFTMTFQLRTFQGVRPALFNFNVSGQPGGFADFDNYTVDEPRARGIERLIPLGKTITFTSGADGSVLAVDSQKGSLVNISAAAAAADRNTRFQVVDLGLGRVALKAANGRFVSVADAAVAVKDLAGGNPGEAESFQWINLLRGDTLLMSLVNHRYLAIQPAGSGPVTVTATGPQPARKGGECFKWQEVSLKDAFQKSFLIGTAIGRNTVIGAAGGGNAFGRAPEKIEKDGALVREQFNQISPENDLKWASIHPRPGGDGYNFGPADAFVNFGLSNNMYVVGHTLVWHGQTPNWVFQGTNQPPGTTNPSPAQAAATNPAGTNPTGTGRFGGLGRGGFTGPRASREELLQRMREHIHTVVGRYRGRIKAWDVVNEAIADSGTNLLRNSLWLEIIGPDFIAKAFEYAHEADPDAILRYNDYGLENPAKRRKLIELIRSLQEQHVPVTAIGSQAHLNVSTSFAVMDQALTEMETLGLPIHITELDVNSAQAGQRNFSADISANASATQGGLVSDADRKLAEAYAGLFRAFLKHEKSVKLVTFWGANDALSWRANGKPLLFDGNNQPKAAFDAVIRAATIQP